MLPCFQYKKWVVLFCCTILFAGATLPAHAQQSGTNPLFIDVQPASPTPGAQTTITIDSSMFDISQAAIRWTVNGSPAAAGNGLRTFTFTMGPAGKSTTVGIAVVPTGSSAFTRTLTFTPGSVLLLWEAATYVPPFYQGKSLYTPGANIRVVAVPDIRDTAGNPIASSDLNFKWQISGDAYADRSGLGKDTLDIAGYWGGGREEVAVDVLRKDGTKAARGVLFIQDENPLVLLYKKDPLRGVLYERTLGENERLTETETTIVAEPFYMSGSSRKNAAFKYTWAVNGNTITPEGDDPAVVTLRQNAGQSGNAVLSFFVENTNVTQLLQRAEAAVNLLLGSANNTTFGL